MHRFCFQIKLWLLCLLTCFPLPISYAQSQSRPGQRVEHRYQRWLPTPSNDLTESSRLLEQLRMNAADMDSPTLRPSKGNNANEPAPAPREDFTQQEIEQIKKLAEQFNPKQNAPLNPSDLDRIPPELIQKFLSSPALQDWARDFVQRNNLDSQIPNVPGPLSSNNPSAQGASPKIPNANTPSRASSSQTNRYSPPGSTALPRANPSGANPSTSGKPDNKPQSTKDQGNSASGKPNSGPSDTKGNESAEVSSPRNLDNTKIQPAETNQIRPKDTQSPNNSTRGTKDRASGPSEQPTTPTSQPPLDDIWGENEPAPAAPKQPQSLSPNQSRTLRDRQTPQASGGDNKQPDAPNPNGRPQSGTQSRADGSSVPQSQNKPGNIEESLRNFEWPQTFKPDSPSVNSSKGQKGASGKANDPGIKAPKSALEKIQKELKDEGWGKTLERIAKEATGLSSGERTVESKKSAGNTSKRPQESIASDKGNAAARENELRQPTTKPKLSPLQQPKAPSGPSWIDSAADYISKLETKPKSSSTAVQPSSKQSTAPSTAFSPPAMPDLSSWFNTWTVGFLLLLLIALCLLYFGRHNITPIIQSIRKERMDVAIPLAELEIRDRGDVVRAFHLLVERRVRFFENWWTSRRVMTQVNTKAPAVSNPMRVAVEVYEMARYLPEDIPIPEAELQRVRVALRDCETAENL